MPNQTCATHPVIVLKVGGRFFNDLLQSEATKHPLLHAIKTLQAQGQQVVVVHGGGDQVQAQLKALNLQSQKIEGLRVTPFSHMPVVTGVLSGYLNKTLVAHSASIDLLPVGLTLADGGMAQCYAVNEALGAVGKPLPKNKHLLRLLLDNQMLPIIASIGSDTNGNLYNVNADHAAICVAQLLGARLLLLSDVRGVLNEHKIQLAELSAHEAQQMIANEVITDGMIVKVQAAQEAADLLGTAVTIGSWNELATMTQNNALFGTQILPRVEANQIGHTAL